MSALAKFRCGVAPMKLETGRYENIAIGYVQYVKLQLNVKNMYYYLVMHMSTLGYLC